MDLGGGGGDGYHREMVNISGLNLVNEASNAAEVEMESCSESMAPGAWSSASPSLTIDKFKNDGHPKDGFMVMNELRRQGVLCDVTLVAEGVRFPVHKLVVASCSPYFRAMFNGAMSESHQDVVSLEAVQANALKQLVDYIYTGEIEVTEENVQNLLPAANLLSLSWVRDSCCRFLQSQLHPSNCLGIRSFADIHSCSDLLLASTNYTEENFPEVVKGDEFLNLTREEVCYLISSDQLSVGSEERVFESVINWVRHDVQSRKKCLPDLLEHVRMPLLSKDYLIETVNEMELMKTGDQRCTDFLLEAMTFHLMTSEQKAKHCRNNIRTRPRIPTGLPKTLAIVGGQAPKAIKKVEAFDFKNECWDKLPEMTVRRCRAGVTVYNNQIWAIGGFNGSLRVRTVDIYDPIKSEWSLGPQMEARRSTLGAAVLNGRLYAVGGFDGSTGLNTAEVFNEKKSQWQAISNMSTRRSSVGVGVVGSFLYSVGGYDGHSRQCLSSVERYDPDADEWTKVADMTTRRSGAGVGVIDGLLYAVGGHDGPTVRKSAEVFHPQKNKWIQISDMLHRRRNAGVASLNGLLYVVGGDDGSSNLQSVEYYNPSSDTWSLISTTMEIGRSYAGVAVIDRPKFFLPQKRLMEKSEMYPESDRTEDK